MRETRQVFLILSLFPGHQPPLSVKEQEFITGCSLLAPPIEVVPHCFLCAVPYTTHTHTHTHTHSHTHTHTHTPLNKAQPGRTKVAWKVTDGFSHKR